MALGAVALAMLFTLAPKGRLGPTNAQFIVSQLVTLRGESGPGAGSIADRQAWLAVTLKRVSSHENAWLVGLGLGPDLTTGSTGKNLPLVRKPHDDYLETYARLGVTPGLAALLATVALALGPVLVGARRLRGSPSYFLWWVFAAAVVTLVIAATQPLLAYVHGTLPLFAALGAGLAIIDTERRRHDTS